MTAPKIGVIGAPGIASALAALGFDPISGTDFREVATAISTSLKEAPFPVIVADGQNAVITPWTQVTVGKASRLVVLGVQPGSGLLAGDADRRLELPASFNDLLSKLGYATTPAEVGAQLIDIDGSFGAAAATSPAAPLPDAVQPDPEPAPVAAVVDQPAPTPPDPGIGTSPVFGGAPVQGAPVWAAGVQLEQAPDTVPAAAPEEQRQYADPGLGTSPVFGSHPAPEVPAWSGAVVEQAATGVAAPVEQPPNDDMGSAGAVPVEQEPSPPVQTVPIVPAFVPTPAAETRPRPEPPKFGGRRGELVFSAAGKGGVGKTSLATFVADVASSQGLKTILVDANRGQADIRKYLRVGGDAALSNAYDAFLSGDPSKAVLMPSDYAHLRQAAKLDVPDFGIVLGPPSDLAGSRYVSAAIYGEIIDYARSIADLVIVDTQIMEAPEERTDIWSDTIIPLLGGDAWLLGITDESSAGIDNLHERLTELRREGVNPARTLVLCSQFLEFGEEDVAFFQSKFAGLGSLVGNTGVDDDFHLNLNAGRILRNSPSIRPAVDAVLLRVSGREELFSPRVPPGADTKKRGLFGKKKGA